LFELPYDRWGAKPCTICEDERFARTGVTISCDAGLCRTYFHVTCAQREGLLQEVQEIEHETEIVDPFVAHCKVHAVQKHIVKGKKRNFLSLQSRMKFKKTIATSLPSRTSKKLEKARERWGNKYGTNLLLPPLPPPSHAPTKKTPRLLTTCPSAVKILIKKAEMMGFAPANALIGGVPLDIRKKWHVPPAFTVEFVSYFIDRGSRLNNMRNKLTELKSQDESLKAIEAETSKRLNEVMAKYDAVKKTSNEIRSKAKHFWLKLNHLSVKGSTSPVHFPNIFETPLKKSVMSSVNGMTPGKNRRGRKTEGTHVKAILNQSLSQEYQLNECGICHNIKDQHLLALCDSCKLYYHLFCLDPPLTRMPKKTRFGGWMCSDCTDKLKKHQKQHFLDPVPDEEGDSGGEESSRKRRRFKGPPAKFVPESDPQRLMSGGKRRGRPPMSDKEKRRKALAKKKLLEMRKKKDTVDASGEAVETNGVIEGDGDGSPKIPKLVIKSPKLKKKEEECCRCHNKSSIKDMVR